MKILILSPYFAPYGGVGSARMISLSQYLAVQGDEVTVLAFDKAGYAKTSLTAEVPDNVRVYYADMATSKKRCNRRYREAAFALLARERFDICVCSVGPYDAMYFAPQIQRRYGVPYVIDYRDMWMDDENLSRQRGVWWKQKLLDLFNTPVEWYTFKRASKVIPVTEGMVERLRRRYHLGADKFLTVFNGYDEKAFSAAGIQPRTDTAIRLCISGKCAYYNADAGKALLVAVKRLRNEGYAPLIEHMGAEEKQMQRMAAETGLDENGYRYLGMLPYEKAVYNMMNADVLIQPYMQVCGLGTKVFDYIAADKPLVYIGTRPSELAEFIEKFSHGFTCDADADQVYDVLKSIIDKGVSDLGCADTEAYSRGVQNRKYREALMAITAPGLDGEGPEA